MNDETAPPGAERSRPVTEFSYGVPEDAAGLLEWSFVASAMRDDRAYWVASVDPDRRPHTRPVWGVWVADTLHCGGGPRTRWVRNLSANPAVSVHRQDTDAVVIVEGDAERLDGETADPDRLDSIDAAYAEKYGVEHGTPVFAIHPRRVFAWTDFPSDATRWTFE